MWVLYLESNKRHQLKLDMCNKNILLKIYNYYIKSTRSNQPTLEKPILGRWIGLGWSSKSSSMQSYITKQRCHYLNFRMHKSISIGGAKKLKCYF